MPKGNIDPEHDQDVKGVRRYGIVSLALLVCIVLISAGAPLASLGRWLAVPLVLAFLASSVLTLFYGSRLVWEWLENVRKNG
jgi:predicted tellurium resistance membrane protein TerC